MSHGRESGGSGLWSSKNHANDWSGIFCFRVQSLQSSVLVKDFETSQRDMMIFAKYQAVDRLNTEVGPVSSVKGESWCRRSSWRKFLRKGTEETQHIVFPQFPLRNCFHL